MMRGRVVTALVASGLLLGSLAGCANDPLAQQYRSGAGNGYISGDGTITEYPKGQRGSQIVFSGKTIDGGFYNSSENLGSVQVVNFWYAGCAPCRAEAPLLQKVATEAAGFIFIGVNIRDQMETAASFNTTYGVTYPSILDVETGAVQLAFAGSIPPAAVPTTLILDKSGRIAARILGEVESESTLTTLIAGVVAEEE